MKGINKLTMSNLATNFKLKKKKQKHRGTKFSFLC